MTIDDEDHSLHLVDDVAVLQQGTWSAIVACKVYESFSNGSRVFVEFSGATVEDFCKDGLVDVDLQRSGVRFRGHAVAIKVVFHVIAGGHSLSQRIYPVQEPVATKAARGIVEVTFVLAHGPELYLDRPHIGEALRSVTLRAREWEVTIGDLIDGHRQTVVGAGAALLLTHSGTCRRADGKAFKSQEVEELLADLSQFLSFVAGWWVGIGLVRGTNAKSHVLWQQWGFTRTHAEPSGKYSWYNWKMVGELEGLFQLYCDLVRRPQWSGPLSKILYWYSRSNTLAAGVDGSVILTQAAFELLAWQVLVQDSGILREEHFHALNAEGQLRITLAHLGVPLQIPERLKQMCQLGKELNWTSSPQALVAIRNQLVHPAKKTTTKNKERQYPYFEAWLLAQHLLELSILRLCKYRGTYVDRTNLTPFSEPESVPWTASVEEASDQ